MAVYRIGPATKWPPFGRIAFLGILALLVVLPLAALADWDPYEVLGVRREASLRQIKKAYRDLARKHHPDKSNTSEDDPGRKFIELNKAFDILKDPAKRSRYDQHGDIYENRPSRGHHYHHHGSGGGSGRDTRESWTVHNGFGGTFTFFSSSSGSADNYYRRKSISTRQYYNEKLKESRHRPMLIFFYTDFCPTCSMIESTWVKLVDELAKFDVSTFTINVRTESRLAHELSIRTIPQIASLVDGQIYHYEQSEISLPNFVRFLKNSLPANLVPILRTEHEQDRHIVTSPQLNRLSAIIINNEKLVKLRYLILAYSLRQYYKIAHVSTKSCEYEALFKRYKLVESSHSHLLVFNERIDSPLIHIKYQPDEFNISHFKRQLFAWPFLKLPKFSSQQRFDDLCLYAKAKENSRVRPSLCVVLFASATPSTQASREKLMEFIELNGLEKDDKVAFAYLDPDKQGTFVQSMIAETKSSPRPQFLDESIQLSIILLERHPTDSRKAHYRWLTRRWNPKSPNEIDEAKLELYQYVSAYKRGAFKPTDKVVLMPLVDEEGPGLVERMYLRMVDIIYRVTYYITSREAISTIMILIACVLLTSLFLYKSPVPSQFSVHNPDYSQFRSTNFKPAARPQTSQPDKRNQPKAKEDSELKIMELKAETYNGMVRLLKPGHRSIILLTDQESKDALLAIFKKAVWPYRKNKTLLFGHLCLDKNLVWYKSLLEKILDCESLQMNKKNCIGTVLSLNGFKKYLRVYHAKHHEVDYDDEDDDGSFLGFDDADAGADDLEHQAVISARNYAKPQNSVYTAENLLKKLPIWLDKMFDGLMKRYFIDEWPAEIN